MGQQSVGDQCGIRSPETVFQSADIDVVLFQETGWEIVADRLI